MQTYFQRSLIERGLIPSGVDARHIEGYIRLVHPYVNELDWRMIKREVKVSLACIRSGGIAAAERNAQSFGL